LRPKIYPVIHYLTAESAMRNAEVAFDAGCDGVFLIHMEHVDRLLEPAARAIKARWPDRLVGINYLTLPADVALGRNLRAGLDMTWTDNAGLNTLETSVFAESLGRVLRAHPEHLFFGGAAFKYQADEPDPEGAAKRGIRNGMVPTTSGSGTGRAADVDKVALMSEGADGLLAIASGITPENVLDYSPFVSHILVASGVSVDEHTLDYEALCRLRGKLESAAPAAE